MGISRDSRHKRRATGGKRAAWRKKRKFELGRQPASTKLALAGMEKCVRTVRTRGGNVKFRALRLDTGSFSWGSEAVARKTRILDVVYNASSNDLVRTKSLVKNCIVQVDATPFRQWFAQHYGAALGRKKQGEAADVEKKSKSVLAKLAARAKGKAPMDKALESQFTMGRLFACVSSRPGQAGRADGYILEGKELEFYLKKLNRKKTAGGKTA
eukprot:c25405_g1_i1.p3 GENE.c25405_g1_i1~~c25405_g1_i1.p3  ORF type:complete len:213 (-),score=38.96 c25405_g1_i1:21-659(-)